MICKVYAIILHTILEIAKQMNGIIYVNVLCVLHSVPALFDLQDTLVLTPEQEESIKYWDGTQYGLNEYVK